MRLFVFLLLLPLSTLAQTKAPETPETLPEKAIEVVQEVKHEIRNTSFFREHSKGTGMVGFEALSSWIPFKLTAGYTHIINKNWSVEAEFARGKFGAGVFGFDLASVTEYRYSLLARRYTGNSFHWIFGLYKDDFRARAGSEYLDNASGTSIDDLKVEVIGATLGFGNRWQWKSGFTAGLDWVRTNIPIFDRKVDDGVLKYVDDGGDESRVKKVINRVASVPSFTLFGIYLGYTF